MTLDFLNSEKNSTTFLSFNKVAEIPEGGFKDLQKMDVEFRESKIIINRNTNLVSDVLYFTRENLYKTKVNPPLFSFFGYGSVNSSNKVYVPDGPKSNEKTTMKLSFVELVSFKDNFFTYKLKQKIIVHSSKVDYTYKIDNIKLITNHKIAYLVYPNGMGRIYKE